jgi:hypothetical protein
MQEYEEYLLTELTGRLLADSPGLAVPNLAKVEKEYFMTAKTENDTIEIWYIPKVWESDGVLPTAYRSVSREWISCPGAECFIAPPFDPAAGISFAQTIFGAVEVGERRPNPENPGSYVTAVSRRAEEYPVVSRTTVRWEGPRQTQASSTGE